MKSKILLSAFACDPTKGSEPGNGWKWASGVAQLDYEVLLLTSSRAREAIEAELKLSGLESKLSVHYIDLSPLWQKAYYWNFIAMYIAYFLWQLKILRYAKKHFVSENIGLIHHVTWGSLKIGTFLYKLNRPLLFGPVGGGQKAPLQFRYYLASDYKKEKLRNRLSTLMLRFNPLARKVLNNASILVTNNDTYATVRKFSGKEPQLVFDAAIDPSLFSLPEARRQNEKMNLLWVGRIYDFKGLRLIIDAFSRIPETLSNQITLTILGDGPAKADTESFCKEKNVTNIRFMGMVDYKQLGAYYSNADVFIFTSLRDSFPSQILEAMAWEMPVISLDLHGQSMMVDNTKGILCSADDPEKTVAEIANAIIYLFSHPEEQVKKGRAARQFALKQTWDHKIKNIVTNFYPK